MNIWEIKNRLLLCKLDNHIYRAYADRFNRYKLAVNYARYQNAYCADMIISDNIGILNNLYPLWLQIGDMFLLGSCWYEVIDIVKHAMVDGAYIVFSKNRITDAEISFDLEEIKNLQVIIFR
tara:strand:+ start:2874 stop:3239 length:366 start_codon:yes stop_codon:yes gene_type:complete